MNIKEKKLFQGICELAIGSSSEQAAELLSSRAFAFFDTHMTHESDSAQKLSQVDDLQRKKGGSDSVQNGTLKNSRERDVL